ncbi:MAG: DUF1697 domain-containing protein [Gemmatimonadaceae bacterium]
MAHVVFLRAANVGGNNVFRPSQLVLALSHLDVVNIGAAGTFVVRAKATPTAIRREIVSRLPFETAIVIRPGKDVLSLVKSDPFRGEKFSKDLRGWVGVLTGKPKRQAVFPIASPPKDDWSVRFDAVDGAFALGMWQRRPGSFHIPATVVEKAIGVSSTVRWWETIVKIGKVLEQR